MNVIITAFGAPYQRAAAFAAATYRLQNRALTANVYVALSEQEQPITILKCFAAKFSFEVITFPFLQISDRQLTTQFKSQALFRFTERLRPGDVNLYADADTFCVKPILLSDYVVGQLMYGMVGIVRDVGNWHESDPSTPWYLKPDEQLPYVNSGVIFAARKSRSFFHNLAALAKEEKCLQGRFNDQKLVNFLFGKSHRSALLLMDRAFNGMKSIRDQNTIIAHNAAGAGGINWHTPRAKEHIFECRNIIRRYYGYAY